MTATDELRRLLDERGIEHHDGEIMTYTDDADYMPSASNTFDVTLYDLTPEQAVEAMLGRGACSMEKRHMDWRCTGCGEIVGTDDPTSELFIDGNAVELWRYCPNCGRKVVDA